MAATSPENAGSAGGALARWRATAGRLLDPEQLLRRVRRFDEDPRVIGVGIAVGVVYAVLMAGNVDHDHPGIARLVAALALLAPSAGISVIATLSMFREPAGLAPVGFNAAVIAACALGLALRFVLAGLARHRVAIRPEFVAIAAYVGLTAFQFLWIALRVARAHEQWARTELTQAGSGLLLIVLVAVVFTANSRRYLLAAMVPGIVVAALTAIASLNPSLLATVPISGWLPLQDISARGTGFFRNPNYLGQAMAMATILVARGRRMSLPGPLTRWSGLLAVVIALAAIASFSRGALLALTAGIVFLYLGRGRRVALAAAAIGTAVVLVGYEVLLVTRHLLTFGAAFAASAAAQAASDAARTAVYKAGIQMFLAHPLLGVGYGQFHYQSVKYLPPGAIAFSHDVYLGIAVEQGLPGILIFLVMLAAIAYAVWRARDQVAVTAGSMLVAFVVGSLFAENLTSLQASCVLWVTIGCALVALKPAEAPATDGPSLASPGPDRIRGPGFEASG